MRYFLILMLAAFLASCAHFSPSCFLMASTVAVFNSRGASAERIAFR
jgi:hypothetical protein